MIVQILQIIAALATILTGLVSLLKPESVTGFTGLRPEGGRGITEIRAILGGFFIALGAAPLFLNSPVAYMLHWCAEFPCSRTNLSFNRTSSALWLRSYLELFWYSLHEPR